MHVMMIVVLHLDLGLMLPLRFWRGTTLGGRLGLFGLASFHGVLYFVHNIIQLNGMLEGWVSLSPLIPLIPKGVQAHTPGRFLQGRSLNTSSFVMGELCDGTRRSFRIYLTTST
jgi:hypothetical protein